MEISSITWCTLHALTGGFITLILVSRAASSLEVGGAFPRSGLVGVLIEAGALSTGLAVDVVDGRAVAPAAVGVGDAGFAGAAVLGALIVVARLGAEGLSSFDEDLVREHVRVLLEVDHTRGELGKEELAFGSLALGKGEDVFVAVGHGASDGGGSRLVELRGVGHGDEGSFGTRETGDVGDGGELLAGGGSGSGDVNDHDVVVLVVL